MLSLRLRDPLCCLLLLALFLFLILVSVCSTLALLPFAFCLVQSLLRPPPSHSAAPQVTLVGMTKNTWYQGLRPTPRGWPHESGTP